MILNDMESIPHKENWAKLVKQSLRCLGFNEVWVAQTVRDVNIFLSLVKQRLHDNFIQNWNSWLRESSRASFYSDIFSFHYQYYLNYVSVRKYRQAIPRLQCSSHRLEIEAGRRYKLIRTPVENRKCKRCDVVENEFHFLFECPLYSELQRQYFDCFFFINIQIISSYGSY